MASSTISGAVPRRPSVYDENSWRTPLIYVETPEDVVLPNLFTEGHDIMRRGLKKYYGKKIPDLIRRGEDVEASAVILNWKDARIPSSGMQTKALRPNFLKPSAHSQRPHDIRQRLQVMAYAVRFLRRWTD